MKLKWIYISVPMIILMSMAGRYIYVFLNQPEVLAPFVAINKSVWEYLKTLIYSILVFWMVAYFARYKLKISRTEVLVGATTSAVISPIMTVMTHYFYVCAFGIHSRMVDFLIAVLAVMTGQFIAHHISSYVYLSKRQTLNAILLLIIMLMAVIIFTYYPPKLPIFMDPRTGSYGIRRIMD